MASTKLIEFYISQMTALILEKHVKISYLLKSQIASAPVKADMWRLRCEKEELLSLHKKLSEAFEIDEQVNSSIKPLVLEELAKIGRKYT
ncbi:hypothetical protein M0G74_18060 [Microbulbifer sp. CAU 1566]|uniref:hypothetical protein n=1 Tax=Microbulbifer sp. CAU 1566 TaxID=2933269 RepID=UPI002002FDDD|nr:hypothetical protein [Microbulbifer sp. CAU 1566]MCK7599183.1 hypothetical protein [Microbulbifer sp. CAU 1566]